MITTINEFKENINESYVRELSNMTVGDTFTIRFKISMQQTHGRIVHQNIQERSIFFELINIEEDLTDNQYNAYTFKFNTGIPNKHIKNKKKFFDNNFIYYGNVSGGNNNIFIDDDYDSYKNLTFEDNFFDGSITFLKRK